MENKNIKKISTKCNVCNAYFDVWVETEHADSDFEEGIRNHINNYCPVCSVSKEVKNKNKKTE